MKSRWATRRKNLQPGPPSWRRRGERRPRLKPVERQLVVFGIEPVRELVGAAPSAVRVLYVRARDEKRFAKEVEAVRKAGGRIEPADEALLGEIAGEGARHQGIIAVTREYSYATFEEVMDGQPDPLLLIDGVTDPRNLGAILRSAECAGARAVVLARDRTAPITPAAIKSSAGAWIHLRIARCGNVAQVLEGLKQRGYWVVALAPRGDVSIYDLDTSRKLALVIGSEGKGARQIVQKHADFIVSIPMRGKLDSLNVSVATAVALFELARRRQPKM